MPKIIKTCGYFPDDDSLVKLMWLGIVGIGERRAAQAGKPKSQQKAPGHLIGGAVTLGWRGALPGNSNGPLVRFAGGFPGWQALVRTGIRRPRPGFRGEFAAAGPATLHDHGLPSGM